MDIQIKEFTKPVITINYEDLTRQLNTRLEEYKNLVVTEETLKGCKAAQKELAGLRNTIETYRKDRKKEAEQPIKAFEEQCKSLVSLIKEVETPIKDGITYFDNQRREEKRVVAKEIIAEECEKAGLNEKYSASVLVLDKYMNLTATESGVREDVARQCFALKVEQDREAERNKLIEETIEFENRKLKNKFSTDDIQRVVDLSADTSRIVSAIREYAASLYEAENYKEPEQTESASEETVSEEPGPVKEKMPETHFYATYKITGTLEKLRSVSAFLKENQIDYDVTEQGKTEEE